MTLQEMFDNLQSMMDQGVHPDTQIQILHQSHYPLRENVKHLSLESLISESEIDIQNANEGTSPDENTVYIVCTPDCSRPYGNRDAWEVPF